MIVFLYGEDDFRSSQKLKEIKNKFLGSATHAGLSFFDFSEKTDFNVADVFRSQGLFSEKRLVILENLISSGEKEKSEEVSEYLEENPGIFSDKDLTVVFREEGLPAKNNKLAKRLEGNKEIKKQNFNKLSGKELLDWLRSRIVEIDSRQKIAPTALSDLILYSGENMRILENETRKLVDFSGGREIRKEDVEKMVAANLVGDIFSTIDSISGEDKGKALRLLLEHFSRGDDPFYLLSMFNYQFRNLLIVSDLYRRGMKSEGEISRAAKLHPFVVKKSLAQMRKFDFEKLKDISRELSEIDQKAKTGKLDIRLALQKFIVEL